MNAMHKISNLIVWASAGLLVGAIVAIAVVIAAACSLYQLSRFLVE